MATLEYRHINQKKSKDFIKKIYNKLSECNMQDVEIILNPNIFKKHNQYFSHMIIK
jgi:hypothetical protein